MANISFFIVAFVIAIFSPITVLVTAESCALQQADDTVKLGIEKVNNEDHVPGIDTVAANEVHVVSGEMSNVKPKTSDDAESSQSSDAAKSEVNDNEAATKANETGGGRIGVNTNSDKKDGESEVGTRSLKIPSDETDLLSNNNMTKKFKLTGKNGDLFIIINKINVIREGIPDKGHYDCKFFSHNSTIFCNWERVETKTKYPYNPHDVQIYRRRKTVPSLKNPGRPMKTENVLYPPVSDSHRPSYNTASRSMPSKYRAGAGRSHGSPRKQQANHDRGNSKDGEANKVQESDANLTLIINKIGKSSEEGKLLGKGNYVCEYRNDITTTTIECNWVVTTDANEVQQTQEAEKLSSEPSETVNEKV